MKGKMKVFIFLVIFAVVIAGCSSNKKSDNDANGDNAAGNVPTEIAYTHEFDLEGEIDFWSWDEMFEDVIVEFNKLYPNIKVNLTVLPMGELHRSEEHTSELQSRENLVCRLLLEKKNRDQK